MENPLREEVKKHYGQIASRIRETGSSCGCGSTAGCCSAPNYASILYKNGDLEGLPRQAVEASLGCANPLLLAELKEGEVVLDLGSGGGIDVLAAARYVGDRGKVYGLDMTEEMLDLARRNQQEMGANNVEFIQGYLEEIPLPDASVDVVMSNCVINLTADKQRVFQEIYRVLKPGGRLAIADIVRVKEVDPGIADLVSLWVSCVAGALPVADYRQLLTQTGFTGVEVEPVFHYTREALGDMVWEGKDLEGIDWDKVDGAFAGALIRGGKEQ